MPWCECVCVCASLSFFSVLHLCIRATLACYIFGAMTDKIYERTKKIWDFFFLNLYEFFPFMHWVHINSWTKKTTKNVRALSLLFSGICAYGSSVHVILFFFFSRNILAVVFFHNHSANGEFCRYTSIVLSRFRSVFLFRCMLFVFLDIIHCSIFRRHITWFYRSYGFNSVVEKLRTCQQGRKRASSKLEEKGGIVK